jgi:hypothetical protein
MREFLTKEEMLEICREATRRWGAYSSWRQIGEECSELAADINRFFRRRITVDKLASEVADVRISIMQAERLLPPGLVDWHVDMKLRRLRDEKFPDPTYNDRPIDDHDPMGKRPDAPDAEQLPLKLEE